MDKFRVKHNGKTFVINVNHFDSGSNYNISVSVYDHMNDLICGWHDKHTKSKEDIKEDVLSHLSSNNDLIIL